MEFKDAYRGFIQYHKAMRAGERLRRLSEGHQHAEQAFLSRVWWPSFYNFEGLHPEFEVVDYKDGFRYLDFAYIDGAFRVAIEIDGYGPHHARASRWQFADSLRRQNQLIIDGWLVLRFAYDDIRAKPRSCQQTLQQLLGRFLGKGRIAALDDLVSAKEREVVRFAARRSQGFTPNDVVSLLHADRKTVYHLLRELVDKQWLEPVGGPHRIRVYRLHPGKQLVRW